MLRKIQCAPSRLATFLRFILMLRMLLFWIKLHLFILTGYHPECVHIQSLHRVANGQGPVQWSPEVKVLLTLSTRC